VADFVAIHNGKVDIKRAILMGKLKASIPPRLP
jgi:hypothetical protein